MVADHETRMRDDLANLNAVKPAVWRQLSGIVDESCYYVALRDDVLFASYCAACWIATHSFAIYNGDPWKQARGDIEKNIEECAAGEEPTDPFMWRTYQLYHANEPMDNLKRVVACLNEFDCTNRKEEDKHKTMSWQRKLHNKMGFNQLACRTYLASVCSLSSHH